MTDFFNSIINIKDADFGYLKDVIYQKTGIFLAPHKKIMLQSRLNIRLRTLGIKNFEDYVVKLKTDKVFFQKEILEIINRITTNKTDFFRENHHFDFLKNTYFPSLEKSKAGGIKKLRIWCSASSTGEEPYSIAITVHEYFSQKSNWDIKIFASDIDTNVLATAEKGVYKDERLATMRKDLVLKYFDILKVEGSSREYQAKSFLKSMIHFQKINLLESPYPFSDKMDIIFCRNVIIYFDKPTQKKLFSQMEKIMTSEGLLIIGHSETLFGITDSFKFLGHTIYQKKT
ncbi:MAG: protein-glutamate O-methyltransferase CheR [Leptospiraceae bacterium]|nr:protein-glutamate O-methyltransferase CheR [Leptospiraceae bacterium]MCP5495820.1 protein-glutamate O-methyltransferase CheR [Leptospiraceae bacterium]